MGHYELGLTKERSIGDKTLPREMVMAIAPLVYELNKCATSMTDHHVRDIEKMTTVCKSAATEKMTT